MSSSPSQSVPAWVPGPFPKPAPQADGKQASYALPEHLVLPDGTPDYLRLTLSADIYDLVKTTPLQLATNLGSRLGCEVLMKREDQQPVFSFKLRGAYNMMRGLKEESRWKGVIACSAGEYEEQYQDG